MRKTAQATMLVISAAILLGFAGPAVAELFFEENFDYPAGQPIAGFGGWEETLPGTPIDVEAGDYEYPGYDGFTPGSNHVELKACCNGNVQHFGPGAALDELFSTDGTFFLGYLTQQSYKPWGGGLSLLPGGHSPGMVQQTHTSPGYRNSVIFNDNSESNVVVPLQERTANGNVHFKVASARALGPITEIGGDGIPSTPVPADCQTFGSDNCEDGKTINDDLANDGFTNYALGFSSNNETTEFTAMRITIDTLGIDTVEVLRNPDPNQDGSGPTGVEATDWDENDTSSNYFINPNPGDLSGNVGYLLSLSGAHNDGGPRYDKIRIADTWQDLLHGSGSGSGSSGLVDLLNPSNSDPVLAGGAFADGSVDLNSITLGDSSVVGGLGPLNLGNISSSGSTQIQAPINATGDITVTVEGDLDISGSVALNGFTLTKAGGGTLTISNIGSGGGTIINTVGALSSALSLTDYTQGADATLISIISGNAGANVAGGHSQMVVTGTAALDGTLQVDTADGFVPSVGARPGKNGASFTILDAGTRNGEFTNVDSHAGNGIFYEVNYGASDVSVAAFQALQGDADGDKDIDISDFDALVQGFDPTGQNANSWTNADFDGDNDVDITDFNSISANFNPLGYANSNAVPEPTGALLIGLGMLLLGTWSVRRSK